MTSYEVLVTSPTCRQLGIRRESISQQQQQQQQQQLEEQATTTTLGSSSVSCELTVSCSTQGNSASHSSLTDASINCISLQCRSVISWWFH